MRKLNLALIVASILVCCGCSRQEPAKAATTSQPPAVRIPAIRAEMQTFASSVTITGTLVSPATVTVKAETTGRVLRFPKDEGDRVAAGEIVAWVDDTHEKLAVRQADSAVQVAQAALERARVVQSHTESEWNRAQNLLKSGGITDRDFKSADLADRDARAQIVVASAQLEQARSQLSVTDKMLQDSVVRAPVAGEIQSKLTSEGAYVEPPTPVFSIVNNTRLELESMIAAADLGGIHTGQQVKFAVNTFPGEQFTGRVIEVSPALQTDTRSAKVRVRVDNTSGRLKAGMFAQGEILTQASRQGILIPLSAVYRDDRSVSAAYVFAVENGRAKRREVTIGIERDSLLEIAKGLAGGDVVAIEQSIELADGVAVAPEIRSK